MSGATIGGILLVLYSIMVIAIGYTKKPDVIFKIAKLKTGAKKSDEYTQKFLYIFGGFVIVLAVWLFTL